MAIGESLIQHLLRFKTLLNADSETAKDNNFQDNPKYDDSSDDCDEFTTSVDQLKTILNIIPTSVNDIHIHFLESVEELFADSDFFNYFNEEIKDIAHTIFLESKTILDKIKKILYTTTISESFNVLFNAFGPQSGNHDVIENFYAQFLQENTLSLDDLKTLSDIAVGSLPNLTKTIIDYTSLLNEIICDESKPEVLKCNAEDEKEIFLILGNLLDPNKNTKKRSLDNSENNNNSNSQQAATVFFKKSVSPSKKPKSDYPSTYYSDSDEELKLAIAESLKPEFNKVDSPTNSPNLKQ